MPLLVIVLAGTGPYSTFSRGWAKTPYMDIFAHPLKKRVLSYRKKKMRVKSITNKPSTSEAFLPFISFYLVTPVLKYTGVFPVSRYLFRMNNRLSAIEIHFIFPRTKHNMYFVSFVHSPPTTCIS
jgi:hypothetical protein